VCSGTLLLVPTLAIPLLVGGCSGIPLHNSDEDVGTPETGVPDKTAPAAAPVRTDPALRQAWAGRWHVETLRQENALVPNLVLELHPDGRLTMLRDDSGGSNFSVRLAGTWTATSLEPNRVRVSFNVAEVQPARRCYALPGNCQPYAVPFTESYALTQTGPDTMETPGAVWRREPESSGLETSSGSGEPAPAAPVREVGTPAASAEPATPAGRFALHLYSVPSPAGVADEWRRLTARYPELAGLELREPRAVQVPGRGTMYTVDAGRFATEAEAEAACDRLRSRGQSCRPIVP
jgi:hypothetical protein